MTSEMLYIYTIYQEGSFSKAAEKLYLTQPALSIAVHKIEKSIGMPLFDRKCKPLRLTDAGIIYLDTVQKIMALEQEQKQRLQDIQNLVTGTVRLGGTHYLNAYILPEFLVSYNSLYPGVSLQITEKSSSSLSKMLARRELDITFNCTPELIARYPHYPIFEDHILLAVPIHDPVNQQYQDIALTARQITAGEHLNPSCPKALLSWFSKSEFILLSQGNNLHERAWQMFREADMQPQIKLILSQMVTAFHMAEASMGVTFISDHIVSSHNSQLLYYPLQSQFAVRKFYALLPKHTYTPIAVQKLIQHIQTMSLRK